MSLLRKRGHMELVSAVSEYLTLKCLLSWSLPQEHGPTASTERPKTSRRKKPGPKPDRAVATKPLIQMCSGLFCSHSLGVHALTAKEVYLKV